jgi:sec-independent protein translocase protein TatA
LLNDILQPTHLLILLAVALLVLGPKRLPSAGRALGQSLREFKSSITGESTHSEAEDRPAIMRAGPADAPTTNAAPEREPAEVGSSGAAGSR